MCCEVWSRMKMVAELLQHWSQGVRITQQQDVFVVSTNIELCPRRRWVMLQELRLHTARGTDLERLTSVMRCLTGITSLALGRSQARFLVPSTRRPYPWPLYEHFPFRFCCCIFCECDGRIYRRG